MKTVVLATGNAHKVEELNRLAKVFALPEVRFVSAKDVLPEGMPHVVEDSGTFLGNARLKASALRERVPAEAPVWLHPEWSRRGDPAVLSAISEWVVSHGFPFRAGWQLHKLFGVR